MQRRSPKSRVCGTSGSAAALSRLTRPRFRPLCALGSLYRLYQGRCPYNNQHGNRARPVPTGQHETCHKNCRGSSLYVGQRYLPGLRLSDGIIARRWRLRAYSVWSIRDERTDPRDPSTGVVTCRHPGSTRRSQPRLATDVRSYPRLLCETERNARELKNTAALASPAEQANNLIMWLADNCPRRETHLHSFQ